MSTPKTKSVVFNDELDLELLRIVHGRNPYTDQSIWELVASDLTDHVKNKLGGNRPACTVRTVKTRTAKLVDKWLEHEKTSKKMSGVNEDYGEKEMILTDLVSYQEEVKLAEEEKK